MTDRAIPDGSDEDLPYLTPAVARAWGTTGPTPTKPGPRPALDLDRIVDAAIAIADANGLDGLSMKRLAGELGFTAMSLYRYVANKDELLMLMIDRVPGTPPECHPARGWRDNIATWVREQLDLLRRHPWYVRLPVAAPPLTPSSIAWLERGLEMLAPTGLSGPERFGVVGMLAAYVLNGVRLTDELMRTNRSTGIAVADVGREYGRTLARLLDPERYPELSAVVASGMFAAPATGLDDDFDFELEILLDGVARYVERRGL